MTVLDPIIFRQLSAIRQIVIDETWLESERRGCRVSSRDQVVCENVCQVILRVGAQMRAAAQLADGETGGTPDPACRTG